MLLLLLSYCDNGAQSLAVCDVLPLFISVFRIFIFISLSLCPFFSGLYRCEASTGILSEEQTLMMFGNTVVRKIFGLKRGRKLRKAAINLHNANLCDRYSSSNITRLVCQLGSDVACGTYGREVRVGFAQRNVKENTSTLNYITRKICVSLQF